MVAGAFQSRPGPVLVRQPHCTVPSSRGGSHIQISWQSSLWATVLRQSVPCWSRRQLAPLNTWLSSWYRHWKIRQNHSSRSCACCGAPQALMKCWFNGSCATGWCTAFSWKKYCRNDWEGLAPNTLTIIFSGLRAGDVTPKDIPNVVMMSLYDEYLKICDLKCEVLNKCLDE